MGLNSLSATLMLGKFSLGAGFCKQMSDSELEVSAPSFSDPASTLVNNSAEAHQVNTLARHTFLCGGNRSSHIHRLFSLPSHIKHPALPYGRETSAV